MYSVPSLLLVCGFEEKTTRYLLSSLQGCSRWIKYSASLGIVKIFVFFFSFFPFPKRTRLNMLFSPTLPARLYYIVK